MHGAKVGGGGGGEGRGGKLNCDPREPLIFSETDNKSGIL
jgi:hypothetical protein